jgi:hypothetical protein
MATMAAYLGDLGFAAQQSHLAIEVRAAVPHTDRIGRQQLANGDLCASRREEVKERNRESNIDVESESIVVPVHGMQGRAIVRDGLHTGIVFLMRMRQCSANERVIVSRRRHGRLELDELCTKNKSDDKSR